MSTHKRIMIVFAVGIVSVIGLFIYRIAKQNKDNAVGSIVKRDNVVFANWTGNNNIYANALNSEKMAISSALHLPIYKFDTKEDLDSFKSAFKDDLTMYQGLDDSPSFDDVTAAYNDSFFREFSLLLAYISASSSSFRFGVSDVYCDGQSFCMYIKQLNNPETYDSMMAGWFAVIEVDKDDIAGCTSFDAVIRL